jgi:hypothetical protein
MNIPIDCPFCCEPLINIFRGGYIVKNCSKKTDHYLSCIIENESVISICITLDIRRHHFVYWYPEERTVEVLTDSSITTTLPYFEPDLSNYKHLVDKVKLYLLYS